MKYYKNKEIKIGNIIDEGVFVSGTKYYVLDKATFEDDVFTVGVNVSWVDPDEIDHVEYTGEVQRIILTEQGDVEVSFDSPIGRVDLEDLTIIR